MDFSALPPEINSARMYAGAGAGPLVEAGQAWSTLSGELYSAAQEFSSVISNLATIWLGPSSSAMTRTATGYAQWLTSTALQAERTAAQASSAAATYSAAFAAIVPPVEVSANRALLLKLVATNLLGQNTPAIAATEALYSEMWAQDAAAMNGYAASSSAATAGLPTFNPAPDLTKSAISDAGQSAAGANPILQFLETLFPGFTPGAGLQNLAAIITSPLGLAVVSSGLFTAADGVGILGAFLGMVSIGEATQAEGIASQAIVGASVPRIPVTVMPAPVEARPVVAAAGASSNSIGGMSVPPSWARPPDAHPSPARSDGAPRDRYQAAIPALPFMPVTGLRSNQAKIRSDPEYGHVSKVLPSRNPSAG